jgi:cell division protein ZipA
MNELRWVLLIVGIAVVAAIYVFGHKEQLRRRRYRREEETTEDTADLSFNMRADDDDPAPTPAHLDELSQTLTEDTGWHAPSPVIPLSPRPVDRASAPKPSSPQSHTREAIVRPPLAGDKIISFYIVARRPGILRGEAIRRAVEVADLEYGEMHIFNKVIKRNGQRHIVFSLANAVRSGTFDLDKLRHFTTPGLVLFMQLPGPMEGLKAFNLMLDCAQRLAGDLDAELLDDSRTVLSHQTIDHMREEVQLFSLRTARARNRVP